MKLPAAVIAVVACSALAGCGGGSAAASHASTGAASRPVVLKTDNQAQTYIGSLKVWQGVSLVNPIKLVICTNGYYSKTERRTGNHLPNHVDATNTVGENVFPSFGCAVTAGSRTFNLYVVPQVGGGWKVAADR